MLNPHINIRAMTASSRPDVQRASSRAFFIFSNYLADIAHRQEQINRELYVIFMQESTKFA